VNAAPPDTIEVEGLTKSFGKLRVLESVNLHVREGEVYGLLGPNGSGKTTLIRSLLGMVRPDSGHVRVLGRMIPDRAILARVGYMTQAAALYPDLSVEENLRFFAAINGAGEAQVGAALRFVDLEERKKSIVATLSGGMRTRVSLACAVVHRPSLMLLDEPTVGVDPQLRIRLWDQFRDLAAQGATILVSSHVMDEAERCDRLGLIRAGKLLSEGTVAELKRQAGVGRLEDAFLKLSSVEDAP
jgi:ABC-2 type transport system ATP-binding protein